MWCIIGKTATVNFNPVLDISFCYFHKYFTFMQKYIQYFSSAEIDYGTEMNEQFIYANYDVSGIAVSDISSLS